MRGLDIDTRNEPRFKVAGLSGKRLDAGARDGARTEAGPVRGKPLGRERQAETPQRLIDRTNERGERAREKDPERERISFEERKRQAVTDTATYRVVSVRDLIDERFGGNAFAARKGIDALKRKGLLKEDSVQLPSRKSFKVLTATDKGLRQAREHSPGSAQRYWAGPGHHRHLRHDAAVYRAARNEIRELERAGGKVKRIRIEDELKSQVARATERARARRGREAAQKAKVEAAQALALPVDEKGRVHYPDAQIEYENEMGDMGRVNVEVTSSNYRGEHIHPKAAAGFSLHANGQAAARKASAAFGNGAGRRAAAAFDPERVGKRGGGGGRKDDDLFEL